MNFNVASNEKSVFSVEESMRFKGAAAVLPPPQMFGMGGTGMGQLPAPMGLSFNTPKPSGFDAQFGKFNERTFQKESAQIRPFVEANDSQFPVFHGEPKRAFGLVSTLEPLMMLNKLERELEFANGIDYHRIENEDNLIRGRVFGDLNNAEFEIRVFSWVGSEGKSYAEFNRFCGDGWVFSRFTEQILNKFGGRAPIQYPALPAIANEYGQEDLEAMLTDVEESYQDISEQSAAELAIQTRNDVGRQMCDRIEGFCPRVLKIVEESTNCAIVRSLLICLANMAQLDGLTKRVLGQHQQIVRNIGNKWNATQTMWEGLFSIAASQEVQQHANGVLMALSGF